MLVHQHARHFFDRKFGNMTHNATVMRSGFVVNPTRITIDVPRSDLESDDVIFVLNVECVRRTAVVEVLLLLRPVLLRACHRHIAVYKTYDELLLLSTANC